MDEIELKNRILQKFPGKYSTRGIDHAVAKIQEMDDDFRNLLETFLRTGQVQEITMGDYTINKLRIQYGMNEIAAYLTMDWIKKHPEEAVVSIDDGITYSAV
ncbi:MAG: hypothetical protein ACOZAO_05080 [Patescibacteria group bacterium]